MTDLTPEQISEALEAGIIDAAQARNMRAMFAKRATKRAATPSATLSATTTTLPTANYEPALIGDEENMRFVRSFSDVFISIGIGLLALGMLTTLGIFGGGVLYLAGAGLLWLMCEYFGRVKRAHLPTLLLAFAYLIFVHKGLSAVLDMGGSGLLPAFVTLLAMLLFYWRFRLPFSIALIALSLIMIVFAVLGGTIPAGLLMILSGLALFIVALAYDSRDTDRKTRFADNAFWLHFTAAPLIIHGLAVYVLKPEVTKIMGVIPMVQLGKADALFMLAIIGGLALVSLAINRRALLVSSLGYAGFAIGFLMKDTGLNFGSVIALTLLLLGGGIVFLGVGWHGARKLLLFILPTKGPFATIFPPT
ncbi:MAG: hypothetical protein L3J05_09645 [Robiginitomaculum sp.]|nr:hypothetical protein [Robiginitomaculum sp.]